MGLLGLGFGSGFGFGFGFGFGLLGDIVRIRCFLPTVPELRVRRFLPMAGRGRRIGVSLGALLERGQRGAGRRRRAQFAPELRVPRLTRVGGRGRGRAAGFGFG